ncbi:nitroreductase family protein [Flavobacterium sp. NRK F7]|uniref:nitroreductase family protein n=1 Tax=Flavobacterium sp. NRK F7 TaxID=2954930 RepID=UPI00209050D8|nr:nitroreductase family protein [Flavobacterium sp. NRK F7]MCO6164229.1 nitroreductase family protein [Flavobacterium sp. NRK F7]
MNNFKERFKNKVYAFLFWQTSFGEYLNKMYDLSLFFKYSFKLSKTNSKQNKVASLTKNYHIVEKGLALPHTRTEFGQQKIIKLIQDATLFIEEYGNESLILAIKNCLSEYYEFNKRSGVNLDTDYFRTIAIFISTEFSEEKIGGTKTITKEEIANATNFDFENFIKARSSIRDFDISELDVEKVEKAIDLARFTPSVCNRQSWKAHLFTKKKDVLKVLAFQNGHGGFKEVIQGVIVVTTDIRMFTKLETNQVFVDGGLFAMNVINALHFYGIGTCPLNTCMPFVDEKKLKRTAKIEESERVIMMIAIGSIKEVFKVAISKRRDLNQILINH